MVDKAHLQCALLRKAQLQGASLRGRSCRARMELRSSISPTFKDFTDSDWEELEKRKERRPQQLL
jgi:hypothetical protein